MNRSEKQQVVEELSSRVGEAKCLYLADFTGLDVASMTELRARLTGAQVDFVVVKNTLARRALADGPYAELTEHLAGPNAFAMSRDDVVSAAKILTEFAKEREKPSIKAGAIEGRVVSIEEIRRLAELPPRDELLAQMVGYAKAPMQGLVFTLNGLLSKLVRTLDAVRAQREEEEPAAESAAAEPEAAEETPAEASAEATEAAGEPAVEEAEESEAEEPEVEADQPEPEAEAEEPEVEADQPEPEAEAEEPTAEADQPEAEAEAEQPEPEATDEPAEAEEEQEQDEEEKES